VTVAHYRLIASNPATPSYDLLGGLLRFDLPRFFSTRSRWQRFRSHRLAVSLSRRCTSIGTSARRKLSSSRAFPDHQPHRNDKQQANAVAKRNGCSNKACWACALASVCGTRRQTVLGPAPGLYRIPDSTSRAPSFKGRLPALSGSAPATKRSVVGMDVSARRRISDRRPDRGFLPRGKFRCDERIFPRVADIQTPSVTQFPFVSTTVQQSHRPTAYRVYSMTKELDFFRSDCRFGRVRRPNSAGIGRRKREGQFPTKKVTCRGRVWSTALRGAP